MERRFLLAILLSVGVIFAWQAFSPPAKPKPAPVAPAPAAGPEQPTAANPPVEAPAGPAPVQQAESKSFLVEPARGEFLRVGFTTRGAAVTELVLRNAFEESPREAARDRPRQPLHLLLPAYPNWLTGMAEFGESGATEPLRTTDWTLDGQTESRVSFSYRTRTGLVLQKTYVLPTEPDRYDLEILLSARKDDGTAAPGEKVTLRLLGPSGFVPEPTTHTGMEPDPITQPYAQIVGKHGEPMVEERWIPRQDLDPVQVETRAFRLCGVKSPYFTAALWSPGGEAAPRVRWAKVDVGSLDPADDWQLALGRLADLFKERGRPVAKEPNLGERLRHCAQTWHRPWVELEVPVASANAPTEAARFHLYAGPLSRRVLAQDRYRGDNSGHFSGILTYPFAFDFLAKFLLFIFDLWNGLTGSTGLAVILMTLVVRGGLMPISIRNQVSMRRHGRKMARLKPKIEQLKARFGKDPKRFREEQMKLFKEHNVGFPMGCLLLLLQIPIFFALFSSLRVEFDLRQHAFAWIADLAGPDRLVDFGLSSALLPFPPGGIWGLNLLPVLYMAFSIYQQSLMPKPTDPQQASQMKMAKWMTIIFPILLYNYTAALALYMCVSSLVAILESLVVRRHDAHHIAKENAAA